MNNRIIMSRCLVSVLAFSMGTMNAMLDETSITQSMVITQSGNYRLENDIVGTLTISNDNVHINLNGKIISDTTYGVYIANQSNINLEYGIIENTQDGVFADTCTNITIKSVECRTNQKGIHIQGTSQIMLDMNSVHDNTNSGIFLNTCSDINMYNNSSLNNSVDGIAIVNGANVTLEQNTCTGNQDGLSVTTFNNNLILMNTFEGNVRGIYMQTASNNKVSRNKCANSSNTGIYLDSATSGNEVSFNKIQNCGVAGFSDSGSGNYNVFNKE